jgi:hypothetical protein
MPRRSRNRGPKGRTHREIANRLASTVNRSLGLPAAPAVPIQGGLGYLLNPSQVEAKRNKLKRQLAEYNQAVDRRNNNKNKSKNHPANRNLSTQAKVEVMPAPSAFGICMTSLYGMRMSGRPRNCNEYEPGVRIVGNTFFHYSASTDLNTLVSGTPILTTLQANATDATNIWNTNDATYKGSCRRLGPATFGRRVMLIASTYRFYAIRDLLIRYCPMVSTATSGNLAISIARDPLVMIRDPGSVVDNVNSVEGVVQYMPCFMSPVWEPCALRYHYNGPKVWSVWSANATAANYSTEIGDHVQAMILGRAQGITAGTSIGRLQLQYVIDFYEPGVVIDTADSLSSERRLTGSRLSIGLGTDDDECKESVLVPSGVKLAPNGGPEPSKRSSSLPPTKRM